MVVIKEQK